MLRKNIGAKEMRKEYTVFNSSGVAVRYINADDNELAFKVLEDESYALGRVSTHSIEDVRAMRDSLLSASDWTQLPDAPLTDSQKNDWRVYRQSLRDITDICQDITCLDDVVWPDQP